MAIMIPTDIEIVHKATSGEKKVFELLKNSLPNNYIVWYEARINNRYPDFIILGPDIGIVVLEVKDWSIDYIKSANINNFTLITNETVANPINQARDYMINIVNILKKDEYLTESSGPYKGNLFFTYGHGVIFTEINRNDFVNLFGSVINKDFVIFKDDLDYIQNSNQNNTLKAQISKMFSATFNSPFLDDKVIEQIKNHISKDSLNIINKESISEVPKQGNTIITSNAIDNKSRSLKPLIIVIASLIVGVGLSIGGLSYIKSNILNVENNTVIDDVQSSYQNDDILNIDEIDSSYLNNKVSIKGNIIDLIPHENGHLFITIQDETGEILVPIFADKNIDNDIFVLDSAYEISGVVDFFQGKLEVIPNSYTDIRPLYNAVNISLISPNDKGSIVTIEGKVTNLTKHKNGHLFLTVADDSGEILVPIFTDKDIDHDLLILDNYYKFSGKVDIFNDQLEIIPQNQNDILKINKN